MIRRNRFALIAGTAPAVGLVCALIWMAGSRNPATPAGYAGYVTQGGVFSPRKFIATQYGPTSTGRRWLMDVINVSITPYSYAEEFEGNKSVLSRDNLRVEFAVNIVWRIHPDRVKQFIEQYSTIGTDDLSDRIVRTAYDNFLREPLRTYARDEIQRYEGLQIKDHIGEIGQRISDRVTLLTEGTPFDVKAVVVGNIQYPREVADAVAEKLAATQILERKKTEVLIATADAERRVAESKGIAESMKIINERLTNAYLQHEAIEAQKQMVASPNHTVIYLPVGPMGVPIVRTEDAGAGAGK